MELNNYKSNVVQFKCLGSQRIHKKVKLQKAMNRLDSILCKTDLILIQRQTYKCNTLSNLDVEAFSKSAYVPFWYHNYNKSVFLNVVASF